VGRLKNALRRVPGLVRALRVVRAEINRRAVLRARRRLESATPEQVFTEIYLSNAWGSAESVSGGGSTHDQTELVVKELTALLSELGVTTILDLPCGDFNWMANVDLDGIQYLGGDIVQELIEQNRERHRRPGVVFESMNLLEDELPRVDLVLSRDCLVHLSFRDIAQGLRRIHASRSEYLLTTTFPLRNRNDDIVTGEWRPLNFELPPFSFPPPIRCMNEGCTEEQGRFRDKSLGLWRIADLPNGPVALTD
jgi:hypothetical protein